MYELSAKNDRLNQVQAAEDLADLPYGSHLCFIERPEILHGTYVILHLVHIAHAGEDHRHIREAGGEADRIAGVAAAVKIAQDLVCLFRKIYKAAALDRFHYDHRLSVLFADLIDLAAFHRSIFIICIVELDLDDLDLRMLRQNHVQDICLVMEGDAEMADQSFLLQRIAGLISLTALILLVVVPVLGVHQVEVEIIYPAKLQLAFNKRADVLLPVEVRRGQLVGQKEFLSGIALCHTVPDRCFRQPTQICMGCIEVVESGFDEGIRHPAKLLIVHAAALHGKAHAAEAEVSVYFREESTVFHGCSPVSY